MAKQEKASSQKIITPTFRVSYPHVFKPHAVKPGDKPKFDVTMLFPKKGTDLTKIKEALTAAKILKYGDKKNWPDDLQSPVNDGDDPKHADTAGYPGHWVIKASSHENSKPGLVDMAGDEILNPSDFYPGCYARAQIFALCWEYMGKEGVMFILDNIQKVKDGESFGGKQSAKKAFGGLAAEGLEDENEDADDAPF